MLANLTQKKQDVLSKSHRKIFYAVLDWGLGHASRSAPIIEYLISKDITVTIGGAGRSLDLLRSNFPHLETIELPAYNPHMDYAALGIRSAWQLSKTVWLQRKREKQILDEWLVKNKCAAIISDNRYGCFHRNIPSAILSHQSSVILPESYRRYEKPVNYLIQGYLKKFNELWIPDEEGSKLSGALSEWKHPVSHYIGAISGLYLQDNLEKRYDLVCVLSGTEPQRSHFENQIIGQLSGSALRVLLVEGLAGSMHTRTEGNLRIISSMQRQELNEALSRTKIVLGRSGYSSIMDYYLNQLPAILIPTKGQSEQEYLAKRLGAHPLFLFRKEEELQVEANCRELLNRPRSVEAYLTRDRKMKECVDRFLRKAAY